METVNRLPAGSARSLPEAVARTLRHEVGDLLQTVYATAAILQRRLPEGYVLERRILSDMRARAEVCKNLLDVVHDYVCPITVSPQELDLADVATALVTEASSHHEKLHFHNEIAARPRVMADVRRLAQLGDCLLANACEAASHQIWFHTIADSASGTAQWSIIDDGPGLPEDQLEYLFTPFFTRRHGHAGLGLALARKLVTLQGGEITAENVPDGGFRVCVSFPLAGPSSG
ncbi:MAG TPA: HAMP domain-containing sensor histidine kinase [Gemmataceae bacterium]|nr:HAMP domain-containing sensor histidine kinase [Gemmataceae bacterium]